MYGLSGLGVTCSPRDPRFAGSNPAEVDGFFEDVKILGTSPPGETLSWGSRVWNLKRSQCIGQQWPSLQYNTIQYNTTMYRVGVTDFKTWLHYQLPIYDMQTYNQDSTINSWPLQSGGVMRLNFFNTAELPLNPSRFACYRECVTLTCDLHRV